jgi:hypothetical protein
VNCRNWTIELVECARTGSEPRVDLRQHLEHCSSCKERWDDERNLSARFQTMRAAAAARRQLPAKRAELLREFQSAHQRLIPSSLRWSLSIAAVLLLAILLGRAWRNERGAATHAMAISESSPGDLESPADLNMASEEDGFLPVPYAPPLAAGEFVRVVRTELHQIALTRMGIDVESYPDEIAADLILGEDGFPRAVRLLGEKQF